MEHPHRTMSYTAASTFPVKTAINQTLLKSIRETSRIVPVHIQINPINLCNLNCDFCSCANRDKKQVLSFYEAKEMIRRFAKLGTKAVTITGGGEPLLYPYINELIYEFHKNDIKIGLVTNGTQFDKVNRINLNKITWCRISHSDKRLFNLSYADELSKTIKSAPDVDWAFSIVVSGEMKREYVSNIINVVEFANKHDFTHIRIVPDLYNTHQINIPMYNNHLWAKEVDDHLAIYQERDNWTQGGDCYIGYIKPYIDADGKIYTCCGAQYAINGKLRMMPEELCFGTMDEFVEKLQESRTPFDGSICDKCYYMHYNILLKSLLLGLEHEEFV